MSTALAEEFDLRTLALHDGARRGISHGWKFMRPAEEAAPGRVAGDLTAGTHTLTLPSSGSARSARVVRRTPLAAALTQPPPLRRASACDGAEGRVSSRQPPQAKLILGRGKVQGSGGNLTTQANETRERRAVILDSSVQLSAAW